MRRVSRWGRRASVRVDRRCVITHDVITHDVITHDKTLIAQRGVAVTKPSLWVCASLKQQTILF